MSVMRVDERLQLSNKLPKGAQPMPKSKSCSECGAELTAGSALCPLCGTSSHLEKTWGDEKQKPTEEGLEDYHSDLRKLRAQLKQLRGDDAEAV
jgi:uncharacterized Zn finger protein (UPF0148 family)